MKRPCLDSNEALAYFYCSRTTNDTLQRDPRAILLSVLRQLASPFPDLPFKPPVLSVYQREVSRGSQGAQLSIDEITALLTDLVQNHYARVTLVIDALDECDVGRRAQLLDIITKLTYNPQSIVKTLVSSRNDPDIERHFSKIPNLSITSAENAGDIMTFVNSELSQRLLMGKASKHLKKRVGDELNRKANGVFRWVALQVDALCDPDRVYSEKDVEYLLPKLPETLEDTYAAIVDSIDTLTPPSRDAFRNVIKLLMCAEYPMNVRQVLEALTILSESRKAEWDTAMILKMARGLVSLEIDPLRFAFAHLSVKEYFERRSDLSGEFAHAIAAEACLRIYLRSDWDYVEDLDFRWYALIHLGRHCSKSGKLRQELRLRDLMQAFFLDRDSNNAFRKWNSDSFKTDVETAPGTCNEKRRSQSRPGLPLFMICVYGFDDFVVPAIEKTDGALLAENFYHDRPLEVAAFYGNFVTMKLVYNAASSTLKSPIRAKEWLAAAALSGSLGVWKFAVKHIENIPLKSAIIKAAQVPNYGKEMVCSLLTDTVDVDEEILLETLQRCASFDTLDVILAKSHTPRFTKHMLKAAVENPFINPELVEMILAEGQKLQVSESTIITAFQTLPSNKESVVKALLNHVPCCEISEEMVCLIARHSIVTDIASLDLLLEHCSIGRITEDLLVAGARSYGRDSTVLRFFLERSCSRTISQQVLQSALLERHSLDRFGTLLFWPECPPVLEESLYIMTEEWGSQAGLPVAMKHCRSLHITDAFLQACAANRDVSEMEMVISLPRAVPISREVVCASLTSFWDPAEKFRLLLHHKCGFDLEPSETILRQALSNYHCKLGLVLILANRWTKLPVTEATMIASVENPRDGTQVFEFLLRHCESVETGLTEDVLFAAIRGDNLEFVEYFKQMRPNYEVKEEYLIAAMNPYSTNMAVLRILLSQLGDSPISSSVLEAAAQQGNQSMVELILEQPGAPHPTPPMLDLVKETPPHIETDEDVSFEAVLSAASKEAMPDQYDAFELGTTKIDGLLSKYGDPKLDSSLLIEAAAEREDGKFVVQYLLSGFPKTVVTRRALLAAARNEEALTTLLDFLLHYSGIKADTELLQQAAGNKYRGTPMVELLLASLPADTEIENPVIAAALQNPYCGRSLLELILERQPNLKVTQDLVGAASENSFQGNFLLHMLLDHSLKLCSTRSADLVLCKMRGSKNGLRDNVFIAACYENESVLRFLLSQAAPVKVVSGELGTPLNVAAHAGNNNAVAILLDSDSDPEACSALYGTPLQSACYQGNLAMIRTLCKHGVELDRQDKTGRTALHTALRQGRYDLVCLLLSLRASTTKCDNQGMTAMHHASTYTQSTECVGKLIESGMPVDHEDSQQWTPLHWAAKAGSSALVSQLLKAGASKSKVDALDRTPFQTAIFCGNVHLRPQLFISDGPGSQVEVVGEEHQGITCDICNMVSRDAADRDAKFPYIKPC